MLKEKNYSFLVCGATFAGLGLAYSAKESYIVIERTNLVGHEYIHAYNMGKEWNHTVLTPRGEAFKKELIDRNILSLEGKVHSPAIAPVLFHRLKEDGLNVMFLTEILDIQKKDLSFEVTIMNASGIQKIHVQEIIDTDPEGIFLSKYDSKLQSKRMNAILHCEKNSLTLDDIHTKEVVLEKGRFQSEAILKLTVEKSDDWVKARHKLHQWWLNKPVELKGWSLAAVATAFEIGVEKGPWKHQKQWVWLPSSAYKNPLESFEAGISYHEGGEKA